MPAKRERERAGERVPTRGRRDGPDTICIVYSGRAVLGPTCTESISGRVGKQHAVGGGGAINHATDRMAGSYSAHNDIGAKKATPVRAQINPRSVRERVYTT